MCPSGRLSQLPNGGIRIYVIQKVTPGVGIKKEAVFGNIRQNMGFRRFMPRGPDHVETETGLVAMAYHPERQD
ncbi:hypothetical protein [Sinomicrobium oceani]|uniref:hypothetical protein n=1 Tax=Sinomicrobium oceani TaxID=1150368 RepID=UPI000931019D|nr:hypothetical protein [Sinomicrobium oceani]